MPFNLFYTMVQKSKKWPKTQIKGGPRLACNFFLTFWWRFYGHGTACIQYVKPCKNTLECHKTVHTPSSAKRTATFVHAFTAFVGVKRL